MDEIKNNAALEAEQTAALVPAAPAEEPEEESLIDVYKRQPLPCCAWARMTCGAWRCASSFPPRPLSPPFWIRPSRNPL